MLKLLYNVGWILSGTSTYTVLYLVENVDTGRRYLVRPQDHDNSSSTGIKFLPFSKSVLETAIAQGNGAFAAAIPYASVEEIVPDSKLDSNGFVTVDNIPTVAADVNTYLLAEANLVPFFSKRGVTVINVPVMLAPVTASNLQLWKNGLLVASSGTSQGIVYTTAGETPATPAPAATRITGIAALDSLLMFFWNNPLLMAVGLFLLSELFGFTNVLGWNKKGKRKK